MADFAHDEDLVNDSDDRATFIDDLYLPPGHRHGIGHRLARGDASKTEIIHHLLGACADDTLTGGLSETQILAELLADQLEGERHLGTLARMISNRLEVLVGLAEKAELERTTT